MLLVVENVSLAHDHRLRKQASSLVDHGFDVSIICQSDPANQAPGQATLHQYPAPGDAQSKLGYIWEYGYSWLMAASLTARTFVTEGFDALQISGTPDIYFTIGLPFKLLGRPLVLDQRDLSPELYEERYGARGPIYWALRAFESLSYHAASHIITVNQSLAQAVSDRGGIGADRVTVVGNGPILAQARRRPPNADLKRGRRLMACWAGLMGPQDRVDLALRAIHRLIHVHGRRDCQFVFIGDGESRRELEQLAAELGVADWTTFTGWIDEDEVFTYLSTADIGLEPNLQPSVSPVKGMEYMAMSVPFVAFGLDETRALAGEAALYAPPGDVGAFAVLVDRLLDDPDLRATMGRVGRRRIEERISWDRQEAAYLGVFTTMLDGRPSHRAPSSDNGGPGPADRAIGTLLSALAARRQTRRRTTEPVRTRA